MMTPESAAQHIDPHDLRAMPYRIAVLCYLYDEDGRILLLHRAKKPNAGKFSPIGGKLEVHDGEGPHDCAMREIFEEAGLQLKSEDVRMVGIVSETGYEHSTHWLIFLFEVTRPIDHAEIPIMEFDEGVMRWVKIEAVEALDIPETDRAVMWPLVRDHRGGFFVVHIDCTTEPMTWKVHESVAGPHHT